MQYDPTSRLARHINLIQSRPALPSELVETLRLTRLAIEKGDAKKRFPTLAMYCDWAVHGELDRNPNAWQLLKRLDATLMAVEGNSDMTVVVEEIGKGLSLGMLRSDLVGFFREKNIDQSLFTVPSNWVRFQQCLLDDLQDRPIGFPDDISISSKAKGRKIYDEMVLARASAIMATPVRRISVTANHNGVPGRPAGYYWNLRIRQDSPEHFVELKGQLKIDASEFPAA